METLAPIEIGGIRSDDVLFGLVRAPPAIVSIIIPILAVCVDDSISASNDANRETIDSPYGNGN